MHQLKFSHAIKALVLVVISCWIHFDVGYACNLSPTPVITSPSNGENFLENESILFNGSNSIANCGSIQVYRWRYWIDGSSPTTFENNSAYKSFSFSEPDTYYINLTVQNSAGKWGYQTIQIVIHEEATPGVTMFNDYNMAGKPIRITDPNGHETLISWDALGYNLEEIEQVKPGGQSLVVKAGYNDLGQVETLWDENNRKRTFEYDSFARLESIRNHSGSILEEYSYSIVGTDVSASNMNHIFTKQHATGSNIRETTQFFDGLGRAVQVQSKDGGDALVATSIQYDGAGREWRGWKAYPKSGAVNYDAAFATNANNYYDGSSNRPDASGRAYVETTYGASPLARPVRINPEGVSGTSSGTVRYSYGVQSIGGNNTTWIEVTDESGKRTRTWTDGWGRTIRSTTGYGTSHAAATNFEYDELGQLTKVISPEGLVTGYVYDSRGRLIEKNTPDAGTSLYVYDKAGNLRFMQDANLASAGRYLEHMYDFAGRMTHQRTCSGGLPSDLAAGCTSPQQAITYTYDDATVGSGVSFTVNNPLGNLTRVDFQGGFYLYSYNNDGNVERMYNKLNGLNARTITYQYNRLGELTYRHMNGNTHRWWYTYNALGQLKLVRTNTSTTQVTDANYSAYWPGGMMQTELLGNQTIQFKYDARDRLLDINNVGSSTPRFSARYTYFANGNINVAQYRQPSSPHSHKRYRYTHTYDNRNQLTGANYNYLSGSTWTNSNEFDLTGLTYDKDGNIEALSRRFEGLKTYSYTYASGTNRLVEVEKNGNPISFTYDANGNLTTIGGSYNITGTTYNWQNLPTVITTGSNTFNYRYDHAGLRVYSSDNQTFTIRGAFGEVLAVYDYDEIEEKIMLNYWNILRPDGTVIGRRKGSSRLYYIRDQLGSTRSIVDASGSVLQTYDYYPFGLEMPGRSLTSGPTARERFTGHERDEEVGLDYMQARRYAAEFGRFLSVDPILQLLTPNELVDFGNAKHLRYSPYVYVRNNPLLFIDPDGFTDRKALLKGIGRTAFGAGGVIGGVGLIAAGAGLLPFSGGTSGFKAFAGASVVAIGASEISFGIADIIIASKTPDGMTAEEFNSFLGIIAEATGGSKTSQEVMNLATDIITGGGLLKIGKNIADDKLIRALIQSGVLSDDIMKVLQSIENENNTQEKDENVENRKLDEDDEKN